ASLFAGPGVPGFRGAYVAWPWGCSGPPPFPATAARDMGRSAARVTHLPPRCDRAYRRGRHMSVTEVRQVRNDPSTGSAGVWARLEDEHRVAERVEAIALLDGDPVETARLLDARERHHQCEKCRARQVEVRQQAGHAAELEARRHVQLGP